MQRIRKNVRRYPDGWGEAHPLTGLMYCADCGAKMYVHRVNNGKRIPQYTCSAYAKVPVGTLCPTQHRINADVVIELIRDLLKAIADYSQLNRDEFLAAVKTTQSFQQISGMEKAEKFVALVDKYQNFDELTTYMLNEFVEKILVHERDRKGSRETRQEVEIYFNFIGKYLPPHFGEVRLTPEEAEELRKREERKDRLH